MHVYSKIPHEKRKKKKQTRKRNKQMIMIKKKRRRRKKKLSCLAEKPTCFWWHGMKKDVAEYVARCLTCQKAKAEH